jgi:AcrR family transcriptional regulator
MKTTPIDNLQAPPSEARALRADARRNADLLIAAAREAFASNGANAPLDDIARAAGVGSGTLYRHFPTRLALIEAVYRDSVERLCADGDRLAATEAPAAALVDWLRGFVTVVSEKRGLAAALSDEGRAQSLFGECHAMINAAGSALLDRAKDAGAIRADVPLDDVLKMAKAFALAAETSPEGSALAERLLTLSMDGLRPRTNPPA